MTAGAHEAGPEAGRRAELAGNLAALRRRIAAACAAAGRRADAVTIVAITKTFPATDVRLLAALGVTDVGENKDQEARAKVAGCADLALRWHFVGQVQTNKARSVASYAYLVHSVDRHRLVAALDRAAGAAGRRLRCLVQVSLDAAPGRGGVPPADLPGLAADVAASDHLDLRGVMAVAPLGGAADVAFARLAEVAAALRADHPAADIVSAGMTGDLEEAVRHGATHVRVGTALLGKRPPLG